VAYLQHEAAVASGTFFDFKYHMHGAGIGTLEVQTRRVSTTTWLPLGEWYSIWANAPSGNQGTEWLSTPTLTVACGAAGSVCQLRVRATKGATQGGSPSTKGDIAIDSLDLWTPLSDVSVTCAVTAEINPAEQSRSYSSVWGNDAIGTDHARSMINSGQAWSAQTNEVGQWMEIDAGSNQYIVGIQVQGRGNNYQFVENYKVQVRGIFLDAAGGGDIFTSTSINDDISTSMLAQPTNARFVRIYPQTWSGHISMRAGLVTGSDCTSPYPTPAVPTPFPTPSPTPCPAVQLNVEPGGHSDWLNNWDGQHDSYCEPHQALTGLYSQHDNNREDRRMKFRCGDIAAGITTGNIVWTDGTEASAPTANSYTSWDGLWERSCPANSYMMSLSSHHDNNREDRSFSFRCREITNVDLSRSQSGWTDWQNSWDSVLDYNSPDNTYITADRSYHDNGREDRKFSFKTSSFTGVPSVC
jgi:hypothetical protein